MTDLRKAAEMALEALESVYGKGKRCEAAIKELRQAIEQAEKQKCPWPVGECTTCGKIEKPEPVAWRAPNWGHGADEWIYRDADDPTMGPDGKPSTNNEPLYIAPPKRKWVGLTDDEAWGCWNWEDFNETWKKMEAKLKEKNNG